MVREAGKGELILDIHVRAAVKDDISILAQLVCGFWNEHHQLLGSQKTFSLDDAIAEVTNHLSSPHGGYFVAVDGLDVLAFRRWELRDEFYFTRELFVKPGFRGRGIAKALIAHFEAWLLTRSQEMACISCVPHNHAMIRLARAEGYEILNTIELRKNLSDSHPEPRDFVTALGMEWKQL